MIPLRAIMVDLDGTLARTAEANLTAYTQALEEIGVRISKEEFESQVNGRHWKQFLPVILARNGSAIEPSLVAARKTTIYVENMQHIEINMGLVALLTASRTHLKTALVTSAARASVMALLKVHDLDRLFEVIVTGDDVKYHKPDPEAYWLAANQLGVSPAETLIYEDSDIGVASATAFGGHVIRVVF